MAYDQKTNTMNYPTQATELLDLLEIDQQEWRDFARAEFVDKVPKPELEERRKVLRKKVATRAERALAILSEIGEPSISNIGGEAAQALSILATHHSLTSTRIVLDAFEKLYRDTPDDAYKESIPAMTDWLAILERRPQTFGTIWLFDENQYPFLPTVEDFEHIDERRVAYGIEPLRWPKSLAIPVEDQPWLKRPVTEATMRQPTIKELEVLGDFEV